MLQWRIWYADGSTFSNLEGEPWEAPANRVLLIRQRDPQATGGTSRVQGKDYYLWKNGKWLEVTYDALIFYWFIEKFDHPRACLAGEMVDNDAWVSIVKAAMADPDFG